MTERMYRCGCPYDADHPDPSRCHQHGAPLEPRVFGEGYIELEDDGTVARSGKNIIVFPAIRPEFPDCAVRVRLVEVVDADST